MSLSDGTCLGAVLTDNGHERKIYIGTASGEDAERDAQLIAAHGAKMHADYWIPFLSKAWNQRANKFCPKCGVELVAELPVQCIGCGTHLEKIITSTDHVGGACS